MPQAPEDITKILVERKEHTVDWVLRGTLKLMLHPDEECDREDIKRMVEEDAGDLDILANSEIDGLRVDEIDGEHIHTNVDSFGQPGKQFCLGCWATTAKP